MSEIQVATRYAKSLIDLSEEQNALEAVKADIESFISVCKGNAQLNAILRNPIINSDKKIAILTAIFGSNVSPVVITFFKIVISKGRSEILLPTATEFINQYNKIKGIVKGTVISAAPLSAESLQQLEQKVKESTAANVVLEQKVDPDLIGGFVLKVGDRQVDTSIATSLNKLKKEFAQKVVL